MDRKSDQTTLPLMSDSGKPAVKCPDFDDLLRNPMVKVPLPQEFDIRSEATHLVNLWNELPRLKHYIFKKFIHAGGSGMVFKVSPSDVPENVLALKIARRSLLAENHATNSARAEFSPVSERELKALEKISHPNVVRLYDAIESKQGVLAIVTSYVDDPLSLDDFLVQTLSRDPDPKRTKGIQPFSPERLDAACAFLVERCLEISSALAHMHALGMFHFDVKPANILIGKSSRMAILTDLGSCINLVELKPHAKVRVNFTWTYAHPNLHDLTSAPKHITGGLKVSAEVPTASELGKYDLFAFGRTIQRALSLLVDEFGERCFSAYGFRFLHLVACLLLDGHNPPSSDQYVERRDDVEFVNDCALDYPYQLFGMNKITSAKELHMRLSRFTRQYSWFSESPELDPWQADIVNTGIGTPAPFTRRVASVLSHPAMRRLKSEFQLGWMREVYPGATHNRWSHTIGVFSELVAYYNALLSDPDIPTLRVLADGNDLSHAMIAALLHDIGQTDFAHDLEAGCPEIFDHESIILRLLDENCWGEMTLRRVIEHDWPQVNLNRVRKILGHHSADLVKIEKDIKGFRPIDGIAADIINGPVDADKFDYLARDSVACGVSYGLGIDRHRFLQSLSMIVKEAFSTPRLALAYRAKGTAAIESLLLARYQMYGAVYWHHTYRCIQAMFVHAVAATFGDLKGSNRKKLRDRLVSAKTVSEILYHRVVCGKSLSACVKLVGINSLPADFMSECPTEIVNERVLEVIWRFADDRVRTLLVKLARRELFKRVFEVKLGDLPDIEYAAVKNALSPAKRLPIAKEICSVLLDAVYSSMQKKKGAARETTSEIVARTRHGELKNDMSPLIVIDFPVRGIPDEKNFPKEISDSARKYISGYGRKESSQHTTFHSVRDMQIRSACMRIFAEPRLHELIVRYLNPNNVRKCIEDIIPICKCDV